MRNISKSSIPLATLATMGFVASLLAGVAACDDFGKYKSCEELGLVNCTQTCANLKTDAKNCGGCGLACANGQFCAQAVCVTPDGGIVLVDAGTDATLSPPDLVGGGEADFTVVEQGDGGDMAIALMMLDMANPDLTDVSMPDLSRADLTMPQAMPDFGPDLAKVDPCHDGLKDGMETDVDCGDDCPQKCAVGKGCAKNDDCAQPMGQAVFCDQVTSHRCARFLKAIKCGDGPLFSNKPDAKSCLETGPILFGMVSMNPADFACSTQANVIDRQVHLSDCGAADFCPGNGTKPDSFKLGAGGGAVYDCTGGQKAAYSFWTDSDCNANVACGYLFTFVP